MNNRLINIPLETLYDILLFLPYHDIINFCQAYKELNEICKDNRFWADKAYHDFNFPKKIFFDMEMNNKAKKHI